MESSTKLVIALAIFVACANVGFSVLVNNGTLKTTAAAAITNLTTIKPIMNSNESFVNVSSMHLRVQCNSTDGNCTSDNVNRTLLLRNVTTNSFAVPVGVNLSGICVSNSRSGNILVYCNGSKVNLAQLCDSIGAENSSIQCVNFTQTWVSSSNASSLNISTSTNSSGPLTNHPSIVKSTVSVAMTMQNVVATPSLIALSTDISGPKTTSIATESAASSSSVEVSSVLSSTAPVEQKGQESTILPSQTQSQTAAVSTSIQNTAEGTSQTTAESTTNPRTMETTSKRTTTELTTVTPPATKAPTNTKETQERITQSEKSTVETAGKNPSENTATPIKRTEKSTTSTENPTFESSAEKEAKDVKFFYVNVLIPIGAGVCGALAIALAVVMFRCCRRRKLKKVRYFGKPTQHMMYMDQMNLLENSSDEE